MSGPITRILVDTGSHVTVGDPLLNVASSDMTAAISTYRKAKNRFDLAGRVLARSQDLLAHKAISERDLESTQADANDAATDLQFDRTGAADTDDFRGLPARHRRRGML